MKSSERPTNPIPRSKKRLFYFLALLIPPFFLVSLEAGLRIFRYGGDTRLFVTTPDENSPYFGINLSAGKRYFALSSFVPSPRKDLFLKLKPPNDYRIFVLGESTAAGFPYGNNLTFPRILNRRLSDAFPERRIEVINTAMTAISTYSMMDFMDEIIEQKPDALLIYAGHNEFYGALGVASMESPGRIGCVARGYLKLRKFKTFVLIRDAVVLLRKTASAVSKTDSVEDPMQTVMSRIAKHRDIPLHGGLYESGKAQFRRNLSSILQKSKKAGIPVILSELVSNVRDQSPFVTGGKDSLPPARKAYEAARLLEKNGDNDAARKAYYRAKDLDALRFRASEEFNEVIHGLAEEYKMPVVPTKAYFESASPKGLIGNNLMHEHLHPNIDGQFLLADAFINTMRQNHFISDDWRNRKLTPSAYYRQHWGFTPLDSAYAALTVIHLKGGWPFKIQGPNSALTRYTPATKVDSVALAILKTGSITLEQGHLELGGFYEKRGEYERALREYTALTYTVPNLDLFYEPVLNVFLTTKQYKRALQFFDDALKYNDSGFVYKWIGQLRLALNDTRGISALEKARDLLPRDTQVLYNLARAYYLTSRFKSGDEAVERLKALLPNTVAVEELLAYRNSIRGLGK
jgi:tetratricopeptide (TPR) repeat protein